MDKELKNTRPALPVRHTIAYPASYQDRLETDGASAFIGKTDHPDSQ